MGKQRVDSLSVPNNTVPSTKRSYIREAYTSQVSTSSTKCFEALPCWAYLFFGVFLIIIWAVMLLPTVIQFNPSFVSHGHHRTQHKKMEEKTSSTRGCIPYAGVFCRKWIPNGFISQRNVFVDEKETLLAEIIEKLYRRYSENILTGRQCVESTREYLCTRAFIPCVQSQKSAQLSMAAVSSMDGINHDGNKNVVVNKMTGLTTLEYCPPGFIDFINTLVKANQSILPEEPQGACMEPLSLHNEKCGLSCSWDAFKPSDQILNKIIMGISLAVSTTCSAVICISYMRINIMKRFPHIIPIYISICSFTIIWIVGIPVIVGYELYCSSYFITLSEQFTTSTFCTIQGVIFHYCIIAQTNWFCCLVYNIYRATVSTQRFSSVDEIMKKLHLLQSGFCWVLPLIFCIIGICVEGYGNHHGNKQVCVLQNKSLHYYILVVPVQIGTLAAATLLAFSILFMKRSERRTHHLAKRRNLSLGKAYPIHIVNKIEKKLMGLSASVVFLNAFVLTRLTFCIHQRHDLDNAINKYISCLLEEIMTPFCSKSYEMYLHADIAMVANLVLGLYPLAVLLFLPSNSILLVLWKRQFSKCCHKLCPTLPFFSSEYSNNKFSESAIRPNHRGRIMDAWASLWDNTDIIYLAPIEDDTSDACKPSCMPSPTSEMHDPSDLKTSNIIKVEHNDHSDIHGTVNDDDFIQLTPKLFMQSFVTESPYKFVYME